MIKTKKKIICEIVDAISKAFPDFKLEQYLYRADWSIVNGENSPTVICLEWDDRGGMIITIWPFEIGYECFQINNVKINGLGITKEFQDLQSIKDWTEAQEQIISNIPEYKAVIKEYNDYYKSLEKQFRLKLANLKTLGGLMGMDCSYEWDDLKEG